MKYLKRSDVKKCPTHMAVQEEATNALAEYGYFSKQEVIESAGMKVMGEHVRWDYLIDFIKLDQDCDLVPIAQRFWKMTEIERTVYPERALAVGHGKKTAGYALVSVCDGRLAVKKLTYKQAIANGTGKKFREFADALEERELLLDNDRHLLEPIHN